jgi:predicted alpha/beta superfamily hydrolase
MDWLTQELKSYIDQNYRTLKGRENTMIAGSSMGGLMSLYSIIKYNAIFGYAACLSSTILLCEPELLKEIEEAKLNPKTKIYLDYGGKEWQVRTAKRMHEDIVAALKEKKVEAMFFYDPKAEHCEKDWEKRIPIFMNFWFNI